MKRSSTSAHPTSTNVTRAVRHRGLVFAAAAAAVAALVVGAASPALADGTTSKNIGADYPKGPIYVAKVSLKHTTGSVCAIPLIACWFPVSTVTFGGSASVKVNTLSIRARLYRSNGSNDGVTLYDHTDSRPSASSASLEKTGLSEDYVSAYVDGTFVHTNSVNGYVSRHEIFSALHG